MAECPFKKSGRHEYHCSMELTVNVIGGKWKMIILHQLERNGVFRFGELKQIIPNITQKMLTQQLRELEQDGLINRVVYAVVPPKVEYSLTELGQTVIPVLQYLTKWGQQYAEIRKKNELCEEAV